jgi:D-beta-D-heptose 7-phosphate kinase/D-beta-D-heptose 1-phosphate adenosyltransferase
MGEGKQDIPRGTRPCCNVAHNIVSLGGHATVIGVAGKDTAGGDIVRMLEETGALSEGIFFSSRPTTVKTRIIAHNQQVVRFDKEEKDRVGRKVLQRILEFTRSAVRAHDAVIISDYKKGVICPELLKELLKHTKARKLFVAVDPKIGHFPWYKHTSLITPNVIEASIASGIEIKDEKTLIRAGRALIKKISCDAVLLTRGEHGMSLFKKEKVIHIPTAARHVYDVTGAGDTVIAAFTLSHAAGAPMEEAAVIANHAAGIVVSEVGTAVATLEKLRKSLRLNRNK